MRSIAAPLTKFLIFVVVTVAATTFLASTIAGTNVGSTATYTARFTDVTAVAEGDDVRMSGVKVGQVEGVKLVDDELVDVEFSVDNGRSLSAAVTATIKYRNMVGQRYIALEQPAGRVSERLPEGGLIPVERTRPALDLTLLFNGFKPLFQALNPDDVNKLSHEIIQVLQGEGGTVESLLAHTASLTTALAAKDDVIGKVVENLNAVLETVNSRDDRFGTLLTSLRQLVSGFAADRQPIGNAITGLAALSDATASLLEQGRQPLKDDIAALGVLSSNLGNAPELEPFLRTLPVKFEAIGRISSYGSWLNFYLCLASSDAQPAPGGPPVGLPITEQRCHR
ncbi:MCE family protein [Saccharothrix variisporea]|uniref:Phospholipid/cholesterol/gamma-HCH transport system substrate-binding protein n=1 Tax=Saccharothrix variisporea TaxID=543527 RepID=A0A495X554_9PSEU|nr:MCE family protein [Saccharothrix variisporea]RKT68355.1 phospholipid/cholesterol/gamma-HCH transport system substrate-binding protein [Saccharothrix variisporea]